MIKIAIALWLFSLCLVFGVARAKAHEWYPLECCSNHDCHEADKVTYKDGHVFVNVGDDLVDVGKGVQWRQSPDGKYHICYVKTYQGFHVYCFFVPGDA